MNKEVKQRLRAALAAESISNKEIAEKTGYNDIHVSRSLNLKNDVLTEKFLNSLFTAFPEFASKHKDSIINGSDSLFSKDAELEVLRSENNSLREQVIYFKEELAYFKVLLQKAMQIHPDLQSKLLSPTAQGMGLVDVPVGILVNSLGTKQGAYAH